MAYTTAQLSDLEAAIASGTLSVRKSDGSAVTFQSLKEMRDLRDDMRAELGVDLPASSRPRISNPVTGRGL